MGELFAMIRRSDAMCIYLLIVSTQFDPDATISDDNPLGLVFWQARVKAQRTLTLDKQAYIVCNPLGLVFHRRRVDERILLCEAPWCVG